MVFFCEIFHCRIQIPRIAENQCATPWQPVSGRDQCATPWQPVSGRDQCATPWQPVSGKHATVHDGQSIARSPPQSLRLQCLLQNVSDTGYVAQTRNNPYWRETFQMWTVWKDISAKGTAKDTLQKSSCFCAFVKDCFLSPCHALQQGLNYSWYHLTLHCKSRLITIDNWRDATCQSKHTLTSQIW